MKSVKIQVIARVYRGKLVPKHTTYIQTPGGKSSSTPFYFPHFLVFTSARHKLFSLTVPPPPNVLLLVDDSLKQHINRCRRKNKVLEDVSGSSSLCGAKGMVNVLGLTGKIASEWKWEWRGETKACGWCVEPDREGMMRRWKHVGEDDESLYWGVGGKGWDEGLAVWNTWK